MPSLFKTVALQKMLIGETRRAFEVWRMEGLPYEKLLMKVKDYARNHRLDGEARRGKQAIDVNKTVKWADVEDSAQETEGPEQSEEEINALANVKCFHCNKKGHYTSKCPLKKAHVLVKV